MFAAVPSRAEVLPVTVPQRRCARACQAASARRCAHPRTFAHLRAARFSLSNLMRAAGARVRTHTHTYTLRTKEGGQAACDEKPDRDENPHTGRQFERRQHSGKGVLGCVRNVVCTQRCATNLAGRDVVDRAAHIGMVAALHKSFVRTSPHFASQQLPPFARRVFLCTQRDEGSEQPRFTFRSSTSQFDTTKQWATQKVGAHRAHRSSRAGNQFHF